MYDPRTRPQCISCFLGLLGTYLFGVADGFSYSLLRTLLYAIIIYYLPVYNKGWNSEDLLDG